MKQGLGPKALNAAVLRIADARGDPVGVGFLVASDLAVTCAHVVSAALGLPEDRAPDGSARVRVDLALLGGPPVEASVERWAYDDDVAVLRFAVPPPGGHPVRLVEPGDVWEHPARAFGFPAGRDGGVWHSGLLRSRQANGWVQADLAGSGYRVSGGFSGGPVWDETLVGVVGMIAVAESGEPPVSYLIPTGGLLEAWPSLRELALPPSPFRGLSAFREADAAIFHGRGEESGELAAKVAAEPRVCLVGPSGSGKSSLTLAGVLPRLRATGWTAAVMRPASGSGPLAALAAALLPLLSPGADATARLTRVRDLAGVLEDGGLADVVASVLERTEAARLLVVVDQCEELFALEPRAAEALADVLFTDTPRVHVLTTMRADFMETALAHPRLGPALRRSVYALGPMGHERLRRIVTEPVEATPGVAYEPGLVDRILTDTGDAPGALPLLGFTLDLLWRQQSGGLLTHRAYEDLGGVIGALGAHADRVWAEYVPVADEPATERLFARLIRLPLGSAAATRRVAVRAELGDEEWAIAVRLAATRLLVTGRDAEGAETVELAHEALITGWNRIGSWVTRNLVFLTWRESLRVDLGRWEHADRSPDLLPTATGLAAADRWLRERPGDLSDAERAWFELGRAHHRSRTFRRRGLWSVLSVLTVLALVLGSLFAYQRHVTADRDALADSRALVQASVDDASQDPVESVMLALAAYRANHTQEARNAVLRAYLAHRGATRVLSAPLGPVLDLQASRDGDVVLARSGQDRATLYTHAAGGMVHQRRLGPDTGVIDTLVSANGRRIGFIDEDGSPEWYDVVDRDRATVSGPHHLPAAREANRSSLAFKHVAAAMSNDGRVIAAMFGDHVVWWDLATGSLTRVPLPRASANGDVWFGPADRTVLTWMGSAKEGASRVVVVDSVTGAIRTIAAGVGEDGAWRVSGDGTTVAACRVRGGKATVTAYRVTDGAAFGHPYRMNGGFCDVSAVDVTGHLAAVGLDPVRLVDLDRGRQISETAMPDTSDASSSYGHLVRSGDHLMIIRWNGGRIAMTELPDSPQEAAISQAVVTNDGSTLIDLVRGGARLVTVRPQGGRPLASSARAAPYWEQPNDLVIRTSPDGTLLADREGRDLVSIREISSLRERARVTTAPPRGPGTALLAFSFFFNGDGRLVTRSGAVVQEWDPSTGRQLARFDASVLHPVPDDAGDLQFSAFPHPSHDVVAFVVQGDPVLRLVDLRTGRVVDSVRTGDTAGVQFDPGGRYFRLLRRGGGVELWRRYPLRREFGPLPGTGDTGTVTSFLDGRGRFLVASDDTIRIYRIGERTYRDSYDLRAPGTTTLYEFFDVSADGRTVLYSSDRPNESLILDPKIWTHELCAAIGHRDFTPDERASVSAAIPAGPLCTP